LLFIVYQTIQDRALFPVLYVSVLVQLFIKDNEMIINLPS